MNIVFAGDSHVTALGQPVWFRDRQNRFCEVPGYPDHIRAFTGQWPRDRNYWAELASGKPRTVVLLWKGNQAAARYLLQTEGRIDFVLSDDPNDDIDPDATIVPESALEAQLSLNVGQLRSVVRRLSTVGIEVIVAQPVAPKEDEAFLRSVIFRERLFASKAKELGITEVSAQFVSARVRLKLWKLLSRIYEQTSSEIGATYLPIPLSTIDERGFLRRDLYANDATHANAEYRWHLVPRAIEIIEGRAS